MRMLSGFRGAQVRPASASCCVELLHLALHRRDKQGVHNQRVFFWQRYPPLERPLVSGVGVRHCHVQITRGAPAAKSQKWLASSARDELMHARTTNSL